MRKGKLITLEGPDTAGKTTLVKSLKSILSIIYPNEVFLFTREPGNLLSEKNNKSESIRKKLLSDTSLSPEEQAKLFAESRYYHTVNIIKELNKGNHVITDRYLFSSIIYQGLDLGFTKILDINEKSLNLLKENNIDINNIVLQISLETYNKRMSSKIKDALEDVDEQIVFDRIMNHNIVATINDTLGQRLGKIYTINANKTQSDVVIEALNHIHKIIYS
ncbi:Thymidylate kinase [uncultured Clostridium sp.]|nr:Thymidylate kinase [uncultured Clostridium sp.]SCI82244.1 Thymidylate kinase [uncultured Clostridium sp.]